MRAFLKENNIENIDFLYNNSYIFENRIITGTRGWNAGEGAEDEKIIKRENIRLELSLQDGIKKYGDDKEIIVCMHYPPFNNSELISMNFINIMNKYNVRKCIYGHLHGTETHRGAIQGNISNIEFKLVSSDYLGFKPLKL